MPEAKCVRLCAYRYRCVTGGKDRFPKHIYEIGRIQWHEFNMRKSLKMGKKSRFFSTKKEIRQRWISNYMQYSKQYMYLHMLLLLTFSMASLEKNTAYILHSTIFAYITVFVFLRIPKSMAWYVVEMTFRRQFGDYFKWGYFSCWASQSWKVMPVNC